MRRGRRPAPAASNRSVRSGLPTAKCPREPSPLRWADSQSTLEAPPPAPRHLLEPSDAEALASLCPQAKDPRLAAKTISCTVRTVGDRDTNAGWVLRVPR